MKVVVLISIILTSSLLWGKNLGVNCTGKSRDGGNLALTLTAKLANINSPLEIKSFTLFGSPVSRVRDSSEVPVLQGNTISLKFNYGSSFYDSAELKLTDCEDSFRATGTAAVKKYVGGFAGYSFYPSMTCSCSLK